MGIQAFRWSNNEIVIVLYFSSRGFRPRSVRCLLSRRGFDRSCRAIESKVALLSKQHAHLRGPQGLWDWRAVDRWIDDLLASHELVNESISFTTEDAENVQSVS